ncbi:MAG: SRPBCC family protein [Betaproteobacteria bacterium]|nr:SRPBCC family protein [Betaproteobacteria bacterium]
MGIRIENSFTLPAPLDEAWRTLVDLQRVVPCMPGAELTEVTEGRRFRAKARLRVGPVELQFAGEGELYDVDDAAQRAKLRAKGSDSKGRGAFQTQMTLALAAQGTDTLVRVDTDLTLTGSVAQYGRGAGMVKELAREMTAQFARNLAQLFAQPSAAAKPALPISGLALLFATFGSMLRRWLGLKAR